MSIRDRDQDAARIHIEEQLALMLALRNSYPSYEAIGRFPERLADKARTAEALGLIGVEERERWEASARRLGAPRPRGPQVKTARERARAHLERLTEDIDKLVAGPRANERVGAFLGAVLAYKSTGLLTYDQALSWQNKLYSAQQRAAPRQRTRHFNAQGTPRIFAGPIRRIAGLRVTSIAVYDDGVYLAWHCDPNEAARQPPLSIPTILDGNFEHPLAHARLTDDAGGRYQPPYQPPVVSWPPVGYPSRNITTGEATFAGTPRRATRLLLEIGNERLSMPIRGSSAETGASPSAN
jgi:hypothetical protein